MTTFALGRTDFLRDGRPHRILSGAVHYFRIHPDQWADRIHKARLMGLNTIETYVAWNAHEPVRGRWNQTGTNDLGHFLDLVAAEGMDAIVRPGPYICAEWHNGGLPTWLTSTPGVGLRRHEPVFLDALTDYLRRVYEIVAPRQIDRGGNVILVQIENEYGAYGDDADYLRELVRVTRDAGITVPLTTIDQPQPQMLRDGSLPSLLTTGSFGSHVDERLATLREHQPTGPLMCAEFWCGWFDWWGGVHHTTSAAEAAASLDLLLSSGASVNIYMFHGGTNFGLTNGANDKGRYLPITTSYDYDAPLDEAGNPTAKYDAFREVISRYAAVPDETPDRAAPAPTPTADFTATTPLLARLGVDDGLSPLTPETMAAPPSFDDLGASSGLVLYSAPLPRGGVFSTDEIRDQAWVFVDGHRVGSLSRTRGERALVVPPGRRIDLLVEEQGRVNYAHRLGEPKGIMGTPRVDGIAMTGWTATVVDLAGAVASLHTSTGGEGSRAGHDVDACTPGPTVATASFLLDASADLFLSTAGLSKGFAFVNGFFLGRYWANGPQRTLYVPRPATRAGHNTVTVIELEQLTAPGVRFLPHADLGPREE